MSDGKHVEYIYNVDFMTAALEQASKATEAGEVPVGCVMVYNNKIIGRGINYTNVTLNGTRHAELMAIDEILEAGHSPDIFHQVVLYVTVEPCIMCAAALRHIGIAHVFFGCANDRFGGNGSVLSIHTDDWSCNSPYTSQGGHMEEEAVMMLRRFYIKENENAPMPKSKSRRVLKEFQPR